MSRRSPADPAPAARPFQALVAADDARHALWGAVSPVGHERVPCGDLVGRVLAADIIVPENVPPRPRAAMDGFALRAGDAKPGVGLEVIGVSEPGASCAVRVGTGQAVRIATGGYLPGGADAVVPVERVNPEALAANCRQVYPLPVREKHSGADSDGVVGIHVGANVVVPGADQEKGQLMLGVGHVLRPIDVAAIAGAGFLDADVWRKPRVGVFSSGNEICEAGGDKGPDQIWDTNQTLLRELANSSGGDAHRLGIIPDVPGALQTRFSALIGGAHDGAADGEAVADAHACGPWDVLMVTGGSSVGVKDYTARAFATFGPPLFHGVAIRPGKPTLATVATGPNGDKTLLVGLPGFPTSAASVFMTVIRPALLKMAGLSPAKSDAVAFDAWWPRRQVVVLDADYHKPTSREDWVRVRLTGDTDGRGLPMVKATRGGPANTSNLIEADGFLRVPAGEEGLLAGEPTALLYFT